MSKGLRRLYGEEHSLQARKTIVEKRWTVPIHWSGFSKESVQVTCGEQHDRCIPRAL
ncbi:hypothetical protein OXYTRIMIC_764 [Oxytricha trifallax]|uniref:Uncharacterized protein n=1 Tax=Oxytricha trifallax TaxID=1172189 RepID=A0A073HYI5_9SPIT|nr:hypothetical protein OXYTRIMIC_764 [Oxytricha trifallax]